MKKERLEAFTDAIIAIIMTVLVLELPNLHGTKFSALWTIRENLITYVVSFFTLAIYWNNHHHLFQLIKNVNGRVLWTNNFFIFFISLFPFSTSWVGNDLFACDPQLFYGLIILLTDSAYYFLIKSLIKVHGPKSDVAELFSDSRKMKITILLNVVALFLALIWPVLTMITNVIMLLFWVIPDRKVEKRVKERS